MFMLMLGCVSMNAQTATPNYTVSGNTYTQVSHRGNRTSAEPEKTQFVWTDTKGKQYPIYISATGSCFIIKTSTRTGKEYRNYLKPEISKDICSRMGREYKGRS